tara:strand:+ start:154 stop:1248 length:1095 start_codon:yes stop_codon:yes gene_type:complete
VNITFVISTLAKGGSERVTSILANRFSKGQYNITILTLFSSKISYDISPEINVISLDQKLFSKERSFFLKLYHYSKRIFYLGKYFKKKDENIIVIGSDILNACLAVSKILFGFKSKLILTVRSNPQIARNFILREIIYFFYKFSNVIVVQSLLNEKFIKNKCPNNKTVVINNPSTLKNDYQNKESIEYDFLSVGRIHPLKNQLDIVKSIKILNSEEDKKFNLCIVGRDQGGEKQIIKYIKKHNLEKYIFFKGEVNDMLNIYSKTRFFVHYSNYEGQSNVLIEAQRLGIPTIVSSLPGIDEMIIHNYNGLVVERNNPYLLAKQMSKLYSSVSLQKEISLNARKLSEKYDVDSVFNNWQNLLKGMV